MPRGRTLRIREGIRSKTYAKSDVRIIDLGEEVTLSITDSENTATIPERELEAALADEMDKVSASSKMTKRAAARAAIMSVIRDQVVEPGDLLPSEKELTKILGVSLGTVQAALRGLQEIGTIVRRRGDGTRVANSGAFSTSVWHYRFASKVDGSPLRFTNLKSTVEATTDRGVWTDYLGECEKYLRVRRQISVQGNVKAGAEMYVDASKVPGLVEIEDSELLLQNLRPYLEENFGIVTAGATHLIQTVRLDSALADLFDLPSGDGYYEIHAKAFSPTHHPVYFQRIYVSSNDCALSF